jgi:hypothetical protein
MLALIDFINQTLVVVVFYGLVVAVTLAAALLANSLILTAIAAVTATSWALTTWLYFTIDFDVHHDVTLGVGLVYAAIFAGLAQRSAICGMLGAIAFTGVAFQLLARVLGTEPHVWIFIQNRAFEAHAALIIACAYARWRMGLGLVKPSAFDQRRA